MPVVSVRQDLAAATAAVHQDLHVHPWISLLARKDLSLPTYALVLGAYHAFFATVERQRSAIGAFDDLSLARQVAVMKHDLTRMDCRPRRPDNLMSENSPMAILGALYALHGAGFGAKTLHVAIKTALPDAPCQYFALGTPPAVWRALTAHVQVTSAQPADRTALFDGATRTFVQFGAFVTAFCADDTAKALRPVLTSASPRKTVLAVP